MKKTLYIFLCLIIVSCGKDDDIATDPLIGVWLSEGTTVEDGGEVSYSFTYTFNSDNTGSESVIFTYDGEPGSESETFIWNNKGLDFKATSQTYNLTYTDTDGGVDIVVNVANFSNDFKTFKFEDFEAEINPFTKQ